MKTAAIISEYNPFHNGHKYHIEETKKITGADYIIAIMSGNFVQRGYPAVFDKYLRTTMALMNGADVVIELPAVYATASAQPFSLGAISILNKIGVIDYLSFGSECGNLDSLTLLAKGLLHENSSYQTALKAHLSSGTPFPEARSKALGKALNIEADKDLTSILNSPNNILGIEYIKSLLQTNSNIVPVTVKRCGSGYHDTSLDASTLYPSATAIRNYLMDKTEKRDLSTMGFDPKSEGYGKYYDLNLLDNALPDNVINLIPNEAIFREPLFADDLSLPMHYKLLSECNLGFQEYLDINKDISDRMINHIYHFDTFQAFCDLLKTKNVTHSRISRCLIHILLNIKQADYTLYQESGIAFYARILGFHKSTASPLLKSMKQNTSIPMISKLSDSFSYLNEVGAHMLKQDIQAAHIYESARAFKYHLRFQDEYRRSPIILQQ